jgi:hypothetical protein
MTTFVCFVGAVINMYRIYNIPMQCQSTVTTSNHLEMTEKYSVWNPEDPAQVEQWTVESCVSRVNPYLYCIPEKGTVEVSTVECGYTNFSHTRELLFLAIMYGACLIF